MDKSPLIIHDFFIFPGGGEKVAVELAGFFQTRLWTCRLEADRFPEDYFPGHLPESLAEAVPPPGFLFFSETLKHWWSLNRFPETHAPWTLFSGSLSILAHRRIRGKKILYCHTPPRLLYDLRRFYLDSLPPPLRPPMRVLMHFYQKAYERAVGEMDAVVANSENVRARLRNYLGLRAEVVHPPCDTETFRWIGQSDYYLSTARVDSLKRVELIVEAFLKIPEKKLVVVSGGPALRDVRALAEKAPNILVEGWVSPQRLRELVGNCIATIYIPRDEDFGISPVESMAAGKPVVGVAEGGLLETVIPGESGDLLPPSPSSGDLVASVTRMTPERALGMKRACLEQAKQFTRGRFLQKMRAVVEAAAPGKPGGGPHA